MLPETIHHLDSKKLITPTPFTDAVEWRKQLKQNIDLRAAVRWNYKCIGQEQRTGTPINFFVQQICTDI